MTDADRLHEILLDHIGSEHPISRHALVYATQMSDRRIRQSLHELVTQRKLPICSSLSGGYFLASTYGELEEAVGLMRRYANEMMERSRVLSMCRPMGVETNQLPLLLMPFANDGAV